MKRLIVLAAVAPALAAAYYFLPAGSATAQADDNLMRQKLDHAQKIIEGLALADYEGIKWNAEKLHAISVDAQWMQPQSRAYGILGDQFRDSTRNIIDAAGKENIEAATLHFMQTVMACVQCHEAVRDSQAVALNLNLTDAFRARH